MWDDLAARARGRAGHLASVARLDRLGEALTLEALAAGAGRTVGGATALQIERDARDAAADDLALLARWAGPERVRALAVLFGDEERLGLRSILRGIAAGTPVDDRLGSVAATPGLPRAALGQLASQASLAGAAAVLAAWRSPFAPAVAAASVAPHPDLFALERAIDRCFFARARAGARLAGRAVREHLERLIDAENALAALVLAAGESSLDPAVGFVDGGRRVDRATYLAAVAAGASAPLVLSRALRGTLLGAALASAGDPEQAALADQICAQTRLARLEPAGPAPILLLALRRRAEVRAVRRAAWRLALGSGEGAA